MKLSIVIPAYNEARKIRATYSRLARFFGGKDYEVEYIFVEDGSTDGTLSILRDLKREDPAVRVIANERNSGKGYSIKKGMLAAEGGYILFIDADMSTPLQAFDDFKQYIGGYDIIMGSRWRNESNIRIPQPWYRRFMGIVFYTIVKAFFLKGISDTNCGFKCYRNSAAKDIFSKQLMRGWAFDVELLYIAKKRGYRVKEVPVIWAHGRDSKVNLFVVPVLTLLELMRIKLNDWRGMYER